MDKKKTIIVFVPTWLYNFDSGIKMFVRGLYRSIATSKNYRLLKINPAKFHFSSVDEARAFVSKHNIAFTIYHDSRKPNDGLDFLESITPFLNTKAAYAADDKFETKKILRTLQIPVLPDFTIKTRSELLRCMGENKLYVVKPHNSASGNGVKLIKRTDTEILEFLDGSWKKIRTDDTVKGLVLSIGLKLHSRVLLAMCVSAIVLALSLFYPTLGLILGLLCIATGLNIQHKLGQNVTYNPLMLEPYFGDGTDEFYCLRCTVINDTVVEATKKYNKNNVTPNISHGGKAIAITLSKEQEALAVAATKAVGATFAGVDLLYAHEKTVVCEVNVGPIGVYCAQTGVNVGKLLGEYVMRQCDKR